VVGFSCLLRHLGETTQQKTAEIRRVLFETFRNARDRPDKVRQLIACAKSLGIPVVDEFDSIRTLVRDFGQDVLAEIYFPREEAEYGHHSPNGNSDAAALIAAALASMPSISE